MCGLHRQEAMQMLHVRVHCVTHPQTTCDSCSHCLPYCHPSSRCATEADASPHLHIYIPTHLLTYIRTYVRIYVYTYLGDARSIVHEDQVSLSPPMCRMARQCLHMSGLVECSPCRSNKDMLQQEPSNARRRLNPLRCCAGDLNVAAPGK